ncbi:MAG: phage portal protein [Bacteroidales bacterium]|nr:phage portal protein [Bacteroidales bacterium]MCM1148161.1 phage portal protein [Bacteroidales bacterium]MCM1207112.1 phage portal protein [Bacillota bacterium]MCM1510864.1 phage portal protein [Clostridium sp.]
MFDSLINFFNAAAGRNQDFDELVKAGDIDGVMSKMDSRQVQTMEAARMYDPREHSIVMDPNRQGKVIENADGQRVGFVRQWRLPIPYPRYINEIALVFLYGRPVKWGCGTEGTERAFAAFNEFLARTHFDSKVRQMKRFAGAYTQSAMLFRVFRADDGSPGCQIRVLSHEKGDRIYSRWDQYENLLSVGWGYTVTEGDIAVEHFDLFLPDIIWHCKKGAGGWDIVPEKNKIGKIPVILCRQEAEWAGVEPQIEREEYINSHTADTNDYFADPQLIIHADIINSMPDKEDDNKTWIAKGDNVDASKAAYYLTWDSAPESKQKEIEQLQNHILSKTFTPNIDFENMKSLSNVSGKALKQMMILASVKAQKHREQHDELMERAGSLIKSIIGNVLDVSLSEECGRMRLTHEFQEPFGEDIADMVDCLVKAVDGGIQSRESAVEQSPLTKDPHTELERISKEQEEANAAQRDMFMQQALTDGGMAE